tara:strand:+ start:877 stop:2640 length:1764 start_codon:yes stop_codon:yes gene_type:complete
MLARKSKPEISHNKYFTTILKAYQRNDSDHQSSLPTPADIFHLLLQQYQTDANKKLLFGYLPAANHTHTHEVEECLKAMQTTKDSISLTKALAYLNTIPTIGHGDLACLLGTFFSVFPELQGNLTNEQHQADITAQRSPALWRENVSAWLEDFKQAHRAGTDSNDYEDLEAISAAIPNDQADDFADFLLAQLNTERPEARPGLYQGWLYTSLGALSNKLSLSKKLEVSTKLNDTLLSRNMSLSTIGLCDALSRLTQDTKQLTVIADHLYRYTVNELPNILDLFKDHHRDTIAHFMPRVFTALHNLEEHFSPITKNDIMNFLIKSHENIYTLRTGISELNHWMSTNQKNDLSYQLTKHDKFIQLMPYFWSWLEPSNIKKDWILFDRYTRYIARAEHELTGTITPYTHVLDQARLAATNRYMSQRDQTAAIKSLLVELDANNASHPLADTRIALHQALALTKHWCNERKIYHVASAILTSTEPHPRNSEMTLISGAQAIFTLLPNMKTPPDEVTTLHHKLLPLLNGTHGKEAASALMTYMKNIHVDRLPELMTCLVVRDCPRAQLLFAQTHDTYQQHRQELKNTIKLVI